MVSRFALNLLFNNSDEIQFSDTCQFCSSQVDCNVGSRFLFAQNINLRNLAVLKSHGLQELVFPAHQAHSSFTVENFATTTMHFNCFRSSFMEPHYLNCTVKQFSSRKSNTNVHSFLEKTDPQKSSELGTVVCVSLKSKSTCLFNCCQQFFI